MTKTYKTGTDEEGDFVVETATATTDKTYPKQWLIDEIARLQLILSKFEK